MTTFETEVYENTSDNVIGARVIVSADEGQTIDDIQVTNKTEFDEIVAKLDVLDETYITVDENSPLQGMTIDDILENSNNDIEINSSLLNGNPASYYAVSSHSHSKNDISNLYNFDISLSSYTVSPDEDITITVKVTKQDGTSVANESVVVYKNGTAWVNGSTNSRGIFQATFSPTDNGLVSFGVQNQKVQCLVEGWKTILWNDNIKMKTNGEIVSCFLSAPSKSISSSSWTNMLNVDESVSSEYYPAQTIYSKCNDNIEVRFLTNGKFEAVRRSGTKTSGAEFYAVYLLKKFW